MPRAVTKLDPPIPALWPERDALLAAVRDADPADDLPALVYADWQDEHGQPEHAELIRVMCELPKVRKRDAASTARRMTLLARMKELFRTSPLVPLRDMAFSFRVFVRGFVRDFRPAVLGPDYANAPQNRQVFVAPDRLDMPAFVPFDKLVGATLLLPPALTLAVTEPLGNQSWLRRFVRVEQLSLFSGRWTPPGVWQPLLDGGHLCNMRAIEVNHGRIAGEELVRIYTARSTRSLCELMLGQLQGSVTPRSSFKPSNKAFLAAIEQIVLSPRAKQFTSFGAEIVDVDEALAKVLLGSKHLGNIREFRYVSGKVAAMTRAAFVERFGPPVEID